MNITKSNNKYYSENYGLKSKIKNLWNKFLDIIRGLSVLATFLLIPACIGAVVYYAFVCYDFFRVLMFLAVLYVVVDTNKKL